jgi:MFS family permease
VTKPPKPVASHDRRRTPLFALLAADAVSITGNTLTLIAVPWFVLQTTGSAAKTGLTGFFVTLPVVLSASLGGVLVDRYGFRRMSVVSDLASGAAVLMIPLLYLTTGLEFWQLLALVFRGALLDAPGQTARSSLIPDLAADAGMRLERATSAQDGVSRGARMIAGPLAGLLIAWVGPSMVLVVDAATFAVSAVLVAALVPRTAHDRSRHESYLGSLREGLAYIRRDRLILAIVVMVMATNMLDMASFAVLLPVYADRILGSPVLLGAIFGVFGVGALTGTIVFGALGHRLPRRPLYAGAFLIVGAPRFFVLAAMPPFAGILLVMGVAGLAAGAINPILSTVQYERVPRAMRARVGGVIHAGAWAAMPVGALAAGLVLEVIGLRATLLATGAL